MTVRDVINAYNHAMQAHGLRPIDPGNGRSKGSQAFHRAVKAFAAWCAMQGVDPGQYILARHKAIGWKRRVPFPQLASASFLATFLAWGAANVAEDQSQERLAGLVIDDTPRDGSRLIRMWEQAKMRFALANDREACRAAAGDLIGGYDARSQWCSNCWLAGMCHEDRVRRAGRT